jgi:hypothetical protein
MRCCGDRGVEKGGARGADRRLNKVFGKVSPKLELAGKQQEALVRRGYFMVGWS